MRKHLEIDPQTREVRLVFTSLHDGSHERDEFRVTGGGGQPVHERHPGEWDHLLGLPVHGYPGCWYIRRPPYPDMMVRVESQPAVPTVRTECRRHGHPRRKCGLCSTEGT